MSVEEWALVAADDVIRRLQPETVSGPRLLFEVADLIQRAYGGRRAEPDKASTLLVTARPRRIESDGRETGG